VLFSRCGGAGTLCFFLLNPPTSDNFGEHCSREPVELPLVLLSAARRLKHITEGSTMDAGALEAQISQQIIIAMKAHDAVRTGTLRLIKNALKNKAIEKREPLTPAESEQALGTMIKQRRDSIEQFTKGNRPELAAIEAAEIVVIEEFLPKALDEAGLHALVKEAIAEIAAASGKAPTPKEIGVVIKAVQAKLQAAGLRAEGRIVSETVKRELAG
jgi:uncharacterized protein